MQIREKGIILENQRLAATETQGKNNFYWHIIKTGMA